MTLESAQITKCCNHCMVDWKRLNSVVGLGILVTMSSRIHSGNISLKLMRVLMQYIICFISNDTQSLSRAFLVYVRPLLELCGLHILNKILTSVKRYLNAVY